MGARVGKVLRKVLGYLLLFLLLAWIVDYWRAPTMTERTLPSLSGLTIEGKSLQSLVKPGRTVAIHFWGTWCPVCRLEAPNIDRIARDYPLLSVAVQSGSDASLRSWMRQRDLHFPVLNDPEGALAKRFGVSVFPTTFIYGSDGTLKYVTTGYTSVLGLWVRLWLAEWR